MSKRRYQVTEEILRLVFRDGFVAAIKGIERGNSMPKDNEELEEIAAKIAMDYTGALADSIVEVPICAEKELN